MISANALGDVIRNLSVEYKYPVVESKYCVFVLFIFRTGLGVASEFRIGNAVDGTGPGVTATLPRDPRVSPDNISEYPHLMLSLLPLT